ncbi:MAG: hypothetical protein ACREO7_10330 [Pseudoxanthomonas sp.]
MRVKRDAYQSWISGQAVAFTWVGALVFPLILDIPPGRKMFWICAAAGVVLVWSIVDGFRAKRAGVVSGFIAKAVVPLVLFALSAAWVGWGLLGA